VHERASWTEAARATLRRLPLPVRRGLAASRDYAARGWASLLAATFAIAPARVRALANEQISGGLGLIRPLDYEGDRIMLHVDSFVELNTRTRSAAKEPETIAWIKTHVRPGDVVFDIGANVGAYSLVIDRQTDGEARTYAFEPAATTFVQLTRNIALNGCDGRVLPLAVAFGARTGLTTFNYRSTAPGAALHAIGEPRDIFGREFEPAMRQPIIVYALDEFLARFGIEQPNHIKLDVDGSELEVLKGAGQTLGGNQLRTVMVELEPTTPEASEAITLLEQAGFRLRSARSHGDPTATSNYLFIRQTS
jgi:FkbM family methyltransferase